MNSKKRLFVLFYQIVFRKKKKNDYLQDDVNTIAASIMTSQTAVAQSLGKFENMCYKCFLLRFFVFVSNQAQRIPHELALIQVPYST